MMVRQLNPKSMAKQISNSVEFNNARFDERRRRSSIRKERGLLSKSEPSVIEVVDVKMRNQKAIQVVFDEKMTLENAPKSVVT